MPVQGSFFKFSHHCSAPGLRYNPPGDGYMMLSSQKIGYIILFDLAKLGFKYNIGATYSNNKRLAECQVNVKYSGNNWWFENCFDIAPISFLVRNFFMNKFVHYLENIFFAKISFVKFFTNSILSNLLL